VEKKSVGLLELETAVLECFLEKTPLSPLGVNGTIEEFYKQFPLFSCRGQHANSDKDAYKTRIPLDQVRGKRTKLLNYEPI
jgi:hypothetical protein